MRKITVFALGLVIFAGLAGVAPGFRSLADLETLVEAASDNILTFDVACDCRTGVAGPKSSEASRACGVSVSINPTARLN